MCVVSLKEVTCIKELDVLWRVDVDVAGVALSSGLVGMGQDQIHWDVLPAILKLVLSCVRLG